MALDRHDPADRSMESVATRVGESLISQLENPREMLKMLGELSGKIPGEKLLMAGLPMADGLKVVQKALDDGLKETPALYRGSLI